MYSLLMTSERPSQSLKVTEYWHTLTAFNHNLPQSAKLRKVMTEQTQLSDCCLTGHLHVGEPKGHEETIAGFPTYVTGDPANKARSIVFLHDVWGWKIPNTRLLADTYADNGFYVYLPDLVQDDTIPEWVLKVGAPKPRELDNKSMLEKAKDSFLMSAEYGPWLIRHREAVTKPLVETFLQAVKQDPAVKKIGSAGFCWGARYGILFATEGGFDAAFGAHPSFLSIPSDLENVTNPVSIAVGDQDTVMSIDEVHKLKAALAEKPQDTEVEIYPGAIHGFSVRGDLEDPKEVEQKEQAVKQAVAFFQKHLA